MFKGSISSDASPSVNQDVSSSSDCGSPTGTGNYFSGEEVILASNTPKKRTGRKKFRETRHPVYRGVRQRASGRWVCEVRQPNNKSRIWLGTFPTLEMAARAHDVAALALRGRSACLNFADSAWRLPVPKSLDAEDIRKAAVEAAEAFRPPEQSPEEEAPNEEEASSSAADVAVGSPEEMLKEQEEEGSANVAEGSPEKPSFEDEEAVFDMHGLVNGMAEGLMMTPPLYRDADVEEDAELSLWNY